ncbi:MAG: SH3 domain-containing protein [Caldilineaceae bacterium]
MKYSNQLGVLGPWVVMALLLSGLLFGMHIMTPPVALAQSNQEAVITNPQPATAVAGTVAVVGTAAHPAFLRYELYFKPSTASADAYIYFSGAATEIVSGQLGIWNTTDLQPGTYDLRLRVVRTDGNYAEYIVPDLQVGTTTEATAALTTTTNSTTTLVPTATPIITEPVEQTATVTATAAPTPTSETVTTPTLPTDAAQILTDRNLNVRGGPSTDFPVVATLSPGDRALVIGQNEVGDWWQIALDGAAETDSGWVLGRLVTAENVDAVPVVGGAAALPASTATPTTVAATELQSTTVTEEAVGAVAPFGAPPFTSDGPVTVTFTGDVENSDALQSFLRSLLVSMGASDTSVTVTVGVLPAELPITLTVPQTATIIGSVSRTGEWGGDQIFLSTAGSADSLLALLRRQVLDQITARRRSQLYRAEAAKCFSPAPRSSHRYHSVVQIIRVLLT